MTRAQVFFCQDGMYYYVHFGNADVPIYVEEDIEQIEGEFGSQYETRVADGDCIHVGNITWYPSSKNWKLDRRDPAEIGEPRHPSYDHEFGRL